MLTPEQWDMLRYAYGKQTWAVIEEPEDAPPAPWGAYRIWLRSASGITVSLYKETHGQKRRAAAPGQPGHRQYP